MHTNKFEHAHRLDAVRRFARDLALSEEGGSRALRARIRTPSGRGEDFALCAPARREAYLWGVAAHAARDPADALGALFAPRAALTGTAGATCMRLRLGVAEAEELDHRAGSLNGLT